MAQSYNETLDEFLDMDYNIGELDTKMSLVPPDTVSRSTIVNVRPIIYQDKTTGEYNAMIEMMHSLDSPEVKEDSEIEDPHAVHLIRLDIKDPKSWDGNLPIPLASGKNKNIELGKALSAYGMNGKPWKWSHFKNQSGFARTGRSRRDDDRFAPIVAVGSSSEDVSPKKK